MTSNQNDSSENSKIKKTVVGSTNVISQLAILKTLQKQAGVGKGLKKTLAIQEIAEISGVDDEREIQRYLFILEGQKLVSPFPEGDFTSRNWIITRTGMEAMRKLQKNSVN